MSTDGPTVSPSSSPSRKFQVQEPEDMGIFDIIVVILYFLGLFGISYYTGVHQNREQEKKASTETYFLAERSLYWWAISLSMFSSNIGSEHFIGLAGSAALDGISVGWYEVGAIPVILMLAFFFLPTYLNTAIVTTADYMERRYGTVCKTLMVCFSLSLYVFSKVAATLFASEIILVEIAHINKWAAVILLILLTTLYTMLGGLEAVIYTEVMQTSVLLVGGFIVLGVSLSEAGGVPALLDSLPSSYFHMFREPSDPEFPWPGMLFGYYTFSIWYWAIDQVIVQRALAAKNIAQGQLGCVGASFLKFFTFFLMCVPGLAGKKILMDQGEDAIRTSYDNIYPWLVSNVVPKNARGLIIASMLSALMSSLASVFNSSATLFTINIWKPMRPDASEKQLVLVGRVSVCVLAVLSLLWLPVIPLLGNRFFLVIQQPSAYFAPPITCVFVWGMLSSFPTRRAGLWTLVYGFLLGFFRFLFVIIEAVIENEIETPDVETDLLTAAPTSEVLTPRPTIADASDSPSNIFGGFTSLNFLYFAIISFVSSTVVLFVLSGVFRCSARTKGEGDDEFEVQQGEIDRTLLYHPHLFEHLMQQYYQRESSPAAEIEMTSTREENDEYQDLPLQDVQAQESESEHGNEMTLIRTRQPGECCRCSIKFQKWLIFGGALTVLVAWIIEISFLA